MRWWLPVNMVQFLIQAIGLDHNVPVLMAGSHVITKFCLVEMLENWLLSRAEK